MTEETITFFTLPEAWQQAITKAIDEILGDESTPMREQFQRYWAKVWSESIYSAKPKKKELEEIGRDLACFLDGWRWAMTWVRQFEITELHSDLDENGNTVPEVVTDCYLVPERKVIELLDEDCDCQECADARIV